MVIKRFFDICASFLGLILLLPVFVVTVLVIKITMPGPILYLQKRIGKNRIPFIIYKFRSMKVNNSGISITLINDSRITKFGRFLRKSKIDEFPQLWNILKGDMSLVGPRPDVPEYALNLQGEDLIIFDLKPGLTGADSVQYPDEESLMAQQEYPLKYYDEVIWPHKVRINKNYIKHWSFWLDIKIIIYTLIGKKLNDSRFN